jgi:dipeptidyl aminopeptidase/acylaminoacyl peptidase
MIRPLSAALALICFDAGALPANAALPSVIPRETFFRNLEKTAPAVSPDGRRLAYLAPSGGVLSIWVRTLGLSDARVVASDPGRPIRAFLWQGDSRHVFYLKDVTGNGGTHVVVVNVASGQARDLTPDPAVRANIEDVDPSDPGTILISTNARDKDHFDVYRLDVARGEATLDTRNPGNVDDWFEDNAMVVRAAIVRDTDGSSVLEVRDSAIAPWRTLATFAPDDGFDEPLGFSADNRSLYAIESKDANAARLIRYDLAAGTPTVVASDPTYDVTDAFIDPRSHEPAGAAILRERATWTPTDPRYAADFEALGRVHAGELELLSASADGNLWIAGYKTDDGPETFYSYDRPTKTGTYLFSAQPELAGLTLAKMSPIAFAARDGLELHGYLTLPPGVAPHALPMVVLVHAGPWSRDRWGYDETVQWLANRGYAVLQVNYRGSSGYGRSFEAAGYRQWAGAMRTDLLDAKDWATKNGVADPARVAIMGESYGGYAVLAALAFSPGSFACGVDIAGMSDLGTLLADVDARTPAQRPNYAVRVGIDRASLQSQSPLFVAERIDVPLLVGQGLKDTRVPVRETDRLIATIRARNASVAYAVFPDEGHGFEHPENNLRFNALVEAFLARNIGGRFEHLHPGESLDPFLR